MLRRFLPVLVFERDPAQEIMRLRIRRVIADNRFELFGCFANAASTNLRELLAQAQAG